MNVFDLAAKITLDTKDYSSAVKNVITSSKSLSGQFSHIAESSETARNKIKFLESEYDSAKSSVDELRKKFNESVKATGANSDETKKLASALQKAESNLESTKSELTEYKEKTSAAYKATQTLTKGLESLAVSGFASVTKAAAVGVTASAAAIAALTKSSISAYAEYEQLKGGVETLFGAGGKSIEEYANSVGKTVDEVKDEYSQLMSTQEKVLDYADNAYKSAGMSANEYMQTVTGFSAALINSVGGDTDKAAELANTAITDMADNANKMGTSLESLQNAYTGFSRGNFTMLDNLALGFSGTKEGMQQLLDKAEEISGIKYDISSYADMVEAIHVVQEKMGIAGTTADEAAETISGSLSAAKSAIQNLVTGFADGNQDIGKLMDNVIETVSTAAENLIPRVQQALLGISSAVEKIGPKIVEILPQITQTIIPPLIDTSISLFETLVETLIEMLPELIDTAIFIIESLAESLIENIDSLVDAVVSIFTTLCETLTNPDTLLKLVDAALKITLGLANGLIQALPELLDTILGVVIPNMITTIIDSIPLFIDAGVELLTSLLSNLPAIIEGVTENIPEIVSAVLEGLGEMVTKIPEIGVDLVKGLWDGIKSMIGWLWRKITGWVGDIIGGIGDLLGFGKDSSTQLKSPTVNTNFDNYDNYTGSGRGNVNITQYITTKSGTAADQQEEAMWQAERAVLMGV